MNNSMGEGEQAIRRKNDVLVAIPCYDEEKAVSGVIAGALKYAGRVLVIDDGSRDGTAEKARLAGADVVAHPSNQGKGVAIRDAFGYAKKVDAGILVLLDGDGQHDPGEIPLLLAPIVDGEADVVNGSRFLKDSYNSAPPYRRLGQRVLTVATNLGTTIKITDSQCGFRAFNKKAFNAFSFEEHGMSIESEMLMEASDAGLRVKEVPISVRYDVGESTHGPVYHGLSVLGGIGKMVSRRKPLVFLCLPGAVIFLAGALPFVASYGAGSAVPVAIYIPGVACVVIGITSVAFGLLLKLNP